MTFVSGRDDGGGKVLGVVGLELLKIASYLQNPISHPRNAIASISSKLEGRQVCVAYNHCDIFQI
jgi:hypothetical protein